MPIEPRSDRARCARAASASGQGCTRGTSVPAAASARASSSVRPGRGDGHPDLPRAGFGVLCPLVDEVLGGAEGVQANGVHDGLLSRDG